MGMIINIDEALKQRTAYNVLREPLFAMLRDQQEAWEKKNPIDLFFNRGTLSTFQETYTSSIGFSRAFTETADFAVGPIFNTAEGFSTTYRTRTFQGSFIITQQALEDGQIGRVRDDATAFMKRWHGDIVEYAVKAISGGFGSEVEWEGGDGKKSKLILNSADTVSGKVSDTAKNPLFYKEHTTVDREDGTPVVKQSNIFRAVDGDGNKITIGGSDPGQIAKLADFINQVITKMENYRDDNGKRAGVTGSKTIVCGNDAILNAAIDTALSMDVFAGGTLNPAYKRATRESSPYFEDIPQCANGAGFFIIDKEYNSANHGPEFTERVPFTLDVTELKRPNGIAHDGRQRFDINTASWRGVTYCYLGTPSGTSTDWNATAKFETITVIDTIVKPVSIVGSVKTTTTTA